MLSLGTFKGGVFEELKILYFRPPALTSHVPTFDFLINLVHQVDFLSLFQKLELLKFFAADFIRPLSLSNHIPPLL